ncbi:MAG: DNA repair protein RecO C-terminal domain-containing protein [Spirochaetaceae bacterium]|jgi:DNA repair protein RecO (recombination protein O)|nr:DNA repair protein RecO C-terminal domain-containing protein [Spirochaetaceae bacterium]
MSRNQNYTALVLRVRPQGESNREAFFLTAEEGILRATLYGGPKSKLRSQVAPWHRGRLLLYHDPVRDSRKVSDFDVESWKPGLRELYERSAAAGTIAETILASSGGGGGWDEALALAEESLGALAEADRNGAVFLLIQFIWKWIDFLGQRPSLEYCSSCACEYPPDGVLWYSRYEGNFLCSACAHNPEADDYLELSPGLRRWLGIADRVAPGELRRYTLDAVPAAQARMLGSAIAGGLLGKKVRMGEI